ncbi:glycosyltransferase family 25 protein [Croceibacterium ferulae]|uniref:glycosyltransferase family 25 protein n=1 Tax=Croceibacterium ferulae TaxID=1854641 RepID=UPI000EAE618F|nr:glycosyltransferase family 25 protein [Croceibacterium ferulae]
MADITVYVISMNSSIERRRRFSHHAEGCGLNWHFFDAHTQLAEGLVYLEQRAIDNHGRPLTAGELGCYSSHYSVWKQFLESGCEQCVVLEDDVIVDWAGVRLLVNNNLADRGIEYLRLYHKRPGRMQTYAADFSRRSLHIVQLFDKAYGTQGYIITRSSAARFLASFKDVVRPIDDQMDRYFAHGIRNLSMYPFLLVEESVSSEIGASRFEKDKAPSKSMRQARLDRRSRNYAYLRSVGHLFVQKALRRIGFS